MQHLDRFQPIGESAHHGEGADSFKQEFQRLKAKIHHELIESLDVSEIDRVDPQQLRRGVRSMAEDLCKSYPEMLSRMDRERMVKELMDEAFGLGPLEDLMHDPSVADILVNNAREVYVERNGRLEETDVVFADDEHLMRIIRRIAARVGRRIDEVSPMVDARLPDGSRVNAVVPPLTLDGPSMSIRRFGIEPLKMDDLLTNHSILPEIARFLAACVEARISFIISGGTGAGKTTLLNGLTASVPRDERLVTIEDSAELILQHKHVVRMETRPANTEGTGAVHARDLVRNSLRMRPDRIIVGEVRGAEALDMLQAMNTGHEGSLTTIHANDTRDALARLEMMVAMAGFDLPVPVIRMYVATGIKLIVHLARLKGGVRRVMRVSEIVSAKDGEYEVQDIFGFEQLGVDSDGVAHGEFYATGHRPAFLKRLIAAGIELPDEMFAARRVAVAG
jgi:pilus assembly protein CpaF